MLLSAPLAVGESRLPPPFPPLFAPPLGCLMSAGRDVLKPPPPPVSAESAALYASYHHAGVAASSSLLHLGYPPSSHAVYPSFAYPAYPAVAARPPLPAADPRPLYPLSFRPALGKQPVVAPPAATRAAPPSFRPLAEEARGFGVGGAPAGKDGVLRVPAHYPAHVGGVFPPPPPPPAATGEVNRAAYPAACTPPRSAAPAPAPATTPAAGYQYSGRRGPSAEEPPRLRMLTAEPASEQPPPAKRARVEARRERPAAPVAPAAPATGRAKIEMPSVINNDHYVPPEHFRFGSIIELADGRLKRVEELRTEDFESSADQCTELRLDRSVVTRIEELGHTAQIVFAVGPHRTEVTVEAQLEHPFFVFHRGWSSCSPRRSLQQYSLSCHQLSVGDSCVSLAPRTPAHPPPPPPPPQPQQPAQHNNHSSHARAAT